MVGLGGKSEPGTWCRVKRQPAPSPAALHAPGTSIGGTKLTYFLRRTNLGHQIEHMLFRAPGELQRSAI